MEREELTAPIPNLLAAEALGERKIDCVHPYTARRGGPWREKLASPIPTLLAAGALAKKETGVVTLLVLFMCTFM